MGSARRWRGQSGGQRQVAAVDLSTPSQGRRARSSGREEGDERAAPGKVGIYICQSDCLQRWVKSKLQGFLSLARTRDASIFNLYRCNGGG